MPIIRDISIGATPKNRHDQSDQAFARSLNIIGNPISMAVASELKSKKVRTQKVQKMIVELVDSSDYKYQFHHEGVGFSKEFLSKVVVNDSEVLNNEFIVCELKTGNFIPRHENMIDVCMVNMPFDYAGFISLNLIDKCNHIFICLQKGLLELCERFEIPKSPFDVSFLEVEKLNFNYYFEYGKLVSSKKLKLKAQQCLAISPGKPAKLVACMTSADGEKISDVVFIESESASNFIGTLSWTAENKLKLTPNNASLDSIECEVSGLL